MKTVSYTEMYNHFDKIRNHRDTYLLSIIIPVYNEEKSIYSVLETLPINDKIEIIVIDDHSKDKSINEIQRAQERFDLKLYSHEKNKGYGKALLTGIKKSNGRIIITMDADGQHLADDIYTIIKPILDNEAEYTIGSRYLGTYHYELPVATRIGELFVEKLIFIMFGQKVANNQGGFRAFDRRIINIFDNIQYYNFAFTTELIIRAALYGYRIKECPIRLMDRAHGKSRIKLRKLALNIIFCLFRYFLLRVKMKMFKKERIAFKKKKLIFREQK